MTLDARRWRRIERLQCHRSTAEGQRVEPGTYRSTLREKIASAINYVGGVAMAGSDRGSTGGITLGGIIVIVGIALMIVWSFWIGLIIALIGLVAFGGFARGKWY
jgi:hypothetical protein